MASDATLLLLGVALGAAPSATVGRIAAAWLAKKAGVAPAEVAAYESATDGDPVDEGGDADGDGDDGDPSDGEDSA
jgi:hypothetical protein